MLQDLFDEFNEDYVKAKVDPKEIGSPLGYKHMP